MESCCHKLTISQKNILKNNRIRIVYGHGFSCAKLNLAGVAMSRRRSLEDLLNEAKRLDKQGMLKEQITI
jgi:hypothetical protein